jgi:hypothetical protein
LREEVRGLKNWLDFRIIVTFLGGSQILSDQPAGIARRERVRASASFVSCLVLRCWQDFKTLGAAIQLDGGNLEIFFYPG